MLFSAPLRDLLLEFASAELFSPRWSRHIHDEWIRAIVRSRPEISESRLLRTREMMDEVFPGATVTGYENAISSLLLPDPDDRHVLAAAIHSGAELIVTFNLSDFPAAALEPYQVAAVLPDDFVLLLLLLAPEAAYAAVKQVRSRLRNPPKTIEEYLDTLDQQRLPQSVNLLRQVKELL